MRTDPIRLPYIDNAKAVFITLAINVGFAFLFYLLIGVSYIGILWESLICAVTTTAINMWIVYTVLSKMRTAGILPSKVAENRLMQRLPQNPFALGLVYAFVFGVLVAGINLLIMKFFGLHGMGLIPWVIYKLIYTTILSTKIIEFCVFRYVQSDWADTDVACMGQENAAVMQPIKNPLPKVSVFKEMFGSVTTNIAMNIIIGTALGGVVIVEGNAVVIYPTTVQGIPITGLVFGLITGLLVTSGVTKAMKETILTYGAGMLQTATTDKLFSWMPKGKVALTSLVCIGTMVFSAVALWAIMMLFGISVLNFYQFTVFITIYATVISKPLSYVLVQRCMQPDYIKKTLQIAANLRTQ